MLTKDPSTAGHHRLAEAIESATPAAWDYDWSKNEFLSNRRFSEIYGFSVEARISFKDFLNATHPDDLDWMLGLTKQVAHLPKDGVYYYRIVKPNGEVRSIRNKIVARGDPQNPSTASAYTGVIEDITEQTKATHALTESETRLRLAIEAGKMAIWEVDLETGNVTNTPELNLLFGLPKEAKPTFAELRALYAPGEVERLKQEGAALEAVREQYAQGRFKPRRYYFHPADDDRTQVQAELSIITPSGKRKRLMYRAQYTFNLEGRPQITGLLVDITERKLAEERLSTIARELQHRVKNSLAIVQALAVQSFRSSVVSADAIEPFQARLKALALATDLILDNEVRTADLAALVEKVIDPYRVAGRDRIAFGGPSVHLPENAVTAMTMVLHELCTNAAKYGALSRDNGSVALSWRSLPGGLFIYWEERNGESQHGSLKDGFGTQLIRTLVRNDLLGTVEFNLPPSGLTCRIITGNIIPADQAT
jgi:two-component sensor histidine kinase/PAS domain-containing protein